MFCLPKLEISIICLFKKNKAFYKETLILYSNQMVYRGIGLVALAIGLNSTTLL